MMTLATSEAALARSVVIACIGGVLTDCELISLHKYFGRGCLLAPRGRVDRLLARTALKDI